jgi:LemA protein
VLWAKTMYSSYKPMNLFSASSQAQSAPTVNFNIAPPGGQSAAPAASAPAGGAPAASAPAAPGSAPPK